MRDLRVLLVVVSIGIAAPFVACIDDGPDYVCEAGLVRECPCIGGSTSVQRCAQTGMMWEGCLCEPCEPGLVRECPCPDGSVSVQQCDAGGTGWGSCQCALPDGDGDVDGDGDTDGDGDSDGDGDGDADGDADGDFPDDLCDTCRDSDECGGPADLCLVNNSTGEAFCSADCSSGYRCPPAYTCYLISGGTSFAYQCVPNALTCGSQPPPPECNPPCAGDQICRDGECVDSGTTDDDLQFCVDEINRHRAAHGRSALARSADLETCAGDGAQEDAGTGMAHGHFTRTSGCGWVADAENEIPGWPLSMYGSIHEIIESGTQMMMDEGPGGGHYENILGDHDSVGCGIYTTDSGEVWIVQDFH